MTEVTMKKERPKHLDLRVIKQPLPAIASILHRVSGAGLFLMLPFPDLPVRVEPRFPRASHDLQGRGRHPLVKLMLIGLLWAFLHHFCMGIRILLLD
jgi:succinate dehydrogenase / fumarate reductase cytochrome b subunit